MENNMAEAQKEDNSGLIQQMMDAVQGHGPTAKKTGDASLLSLDEPPVMAGLSSPCCGRFSPRVSATTSGFLLPDYVARLS